MGEKTELKVELRRHLGAGKDSWFGAKLDEAVDFILAQPTSHLPDGWRPERTAIARTIDPNIWAARDRAFSGDPHTPWDVVLNDSLLSASLATADAILALPRAHAEKG